MKSPTRAETCFTPRARYRHAASAVLTAALLAVAGGGCTTAGARPAWSPIGAEAQAAPAEAPPATVFGDARSWTEEDRVAAGLVAAERKRRKLETRGPKSFNQPQERQDFFLEQRLPKESRVYPVLHLQRELAATRERQAALAAQAGGGPQTGGIDAYVELGPGNIGGRTRTLVIDPTNPQTMYAAGVAGGIWKSVNGGASWTAQDDLMVNLAVSTIVIDPTNTSVLYAGTGEGILAGPAIRGQGIFKSVDAGETWTQLPGTVEGVPQGAFDYVNKIVLSPDDPSRIYAATRSGVWRSLDAGASWSVVLSNPRYLVVAPTSNGSQAGCTDLEIRSDTAPGPDVLFASFGIFESDGLFRSDDGGDSWLAYTVPANQGRMTIAFAPSDNDVLYILMADNGQGGATGQLVNVYRSADGGDTFEGRVEFDTLFGSWLLSNVALATGCIAGGTYSQGWYDNIIAVDPVDPDIVWVGGVDIFRSDDGGRTYGLGGYWLFYIMDPAPPYQIHPDHHEIVFHPSYNGFSNQTMFVTNDGGIFKTVNARAATTQEDCPLPGDDPLPDIIWSRLNNGYGVTQFYHGDAAIEVDRYVGGSQDNGTSMVEDVGTIDEWRMIFGGDGGYVAIDPVNDQTIFVEYQSFPTFQKSVDGGDTFFEATSGITDTDGLFITPFALDQANPSVLWTGGSRPWRTTNGAASWEVAGPNFAGPAKISAVAVAPSDSNVVYLGFTNGFAARTTNALAPFPSWTVLENGLFAAWVSSVAVDPANPDVAYLTYSYFGVPHVLRTTDGGLSWTPIDEGFGSAGIPDVPAHWVAVRPCDSEQLYVGTEIGLFASDNGGVSWEPSNEGFANTIVESLDFKNDDTLVLFSHGRGAFIAQLVPCASCPADFDGDGFVGFDELLAVLSQWGPCGGCVEDVDGSGDVGFGDLLVVLSRWGPCS